MSVPVVGLNAFFIRENKPAPWSEVSRSRIPKPPTCLQWVECPDIAGFKFYLDLVSQNSRARASDTQSASQRKCRLFFRTGAPHRGQYVGDACQPCPQTLHFIKNAVWAASGSKSILMKRKDEPRTRETQVTR